jgi:hypothetical protein
VTGIYPRSVSGAGKECFPWTRVTNEVSACACRGRVYYTWECPGKSGVCWWRRGSTIAGYTKGSRGVPGGGDDVLWLGGGRQSEGVRADGVL